jgi:glycine dehydrogenase subunit 2
MREPKFRQAHYSEPLLSELDHRLLDDGQENDLSDVPVKLRRDELKIPNLREHEVVRHYTRLSQMSFGTDSGFYPLGSCTMKYNPKLQEEVSRFWCATGIHPNQDEGTVQGALQVLYELQELLTRITDMDACSLQPAAGAQGEFTGLLIAKAYHELRGEKRTEVIIPDAAHGTNPASAAMAGFDVVEIPSKDGIVDTDGLRSAVSEKTAAFMLTNPNTFGIFEPDVLELADIVHGAGALLYYDGANLNAIMGKTSPGRMGFDIAHLNPHKTFGTPHGGGGPGAGPITVKKHLADFLPEPVVNSDGTKYYLDHSPPHSIGKVQNFYGNFGVLLRMYVYIRRLGKDGLEWATERSVLNANYLKSRLEPLLELPFDSKARKHEFVLSGGSLKKKGLRTLDLAKRLLDHGYHAPTIYFPLLVDEALMIEPTETETKRTLDGFADAIESILDEDVEKVKGAPYNTSLSRVDEVTAAKNPILSWRMATSK